MGGVSEAGRRGLGYWSQCRGGDAARPHPARSSCSLARFRSDRSGWPSRKQEGLSLGSFLSCPPTGSGITGSESG